MLVVTARGVEVARVECQVAHVLQGRSHPRSVAKLFPQLETLLRQPPGEHGHAESPRENTSRFEELSAQRRGLTHVSERALDPGEALEQVPGRTPVLPQMRAQQSLRFVIVLVR